jgi:hypothetical protein
MGAAAIMARVLFVYVDDIQHKSIYSLCFVQIGICFEKARSNPKKITKKIGGPSHDTSKI